LDHTVALDTRNFDLPSRVGAGPRKNQKLNFSSRKAARGKRTVGAYVHRRSPSASGVPAVSREKSHDHQLTIFLPGRFLIHAVENYDT
jgi:hypothetical protein